MKIQTWAVALTLILSPMAVFAGSPGDAPYATGTEGMVSALRTRVSQDRTQWAFLKVRLSQVQGKVNELRMRRDRAKKRYAMNDDALNEAFRAFDKLDSNITGFKVDFNGQDAAPFIDDQEREIDRLAQASHGDADPLAFEPVDNNLTTLEKRSSEIDRELSDRYLDAGYVAAGFDHALARLTPPSPMADAVGY